MNTIARGSTMTAGLFKVYSRMSAGTADLGDLPRLVDFCLASGKKILHLLPLNEMGRSFNPTEPVSVFSLEPMYAALTAGDDREALKRIKEFSAAFPAGKTNVDPYFKEKKFNLLWEIYLSELRTGRLDRRKLKDFAERNRYWLEDYALFKVIGDYQSGRPWYEWEERYKHRDPRALDDFSKEHEKELVFDYWVQANLHERLKEAAHYAERRAVVLGADFPLLPSRNSAEVWSQQELFRLEFDAGLPPEKLSPAGVRFQAPVCNWQKMSSDGFGFLRRRLAHSAQFFRQLRLARAVKQVLPGPVKMILSEAGVIRETGSTGCELKGEF